MLNYVRSLCKRVGKAEATIPLLYDQVRLISSASNLIVSVRVVFQVKVNAM